MKLPKSGDAASNSATEARDDSIVEASGRSRQEIAGKTSVEFEV